MNISVRKGKGVIFIERTLFKGKIDSTATAAAAITFFMFYSPAEQEPEVVTASTPDDGLWLAAVLRHVRL
ncbi:hypothetical protein MJ575_24370 [Klebsiella pneumoniae]|nr:hypothetical protein MJ575_24370 [Klebsiella pneumoniae]